MSAEKNSWAAEVPQCGRSSWFPWFSAFLGVHLGGKGRKEERRQSQDGLIHYLPEPNPGKHSISKIITNIQKATNKLLKIKQISHVEFLCSSTLYLSLTSILISHLKLTHNCHVSPSWVLLEVRMVRQHLTLDLTWGEVVNARQHHRI